MQATDPGESVGPYRIEGTLGEGGMGAVYRARDRNSGQVLALKRLLPSAAAHRERVLELFEREYHTLAQLSHPALVQVFDYGVDDGGAYYTMELLEGAQLHRAERMPIPELCAVLCSVASCLSLLHARRLVHRDVTARNIIVTGPGQAKLIDFGALAPMGPTLGVVGTPTHVAPEAVGLQALDGRADLYALGVVMYRALTGQYPYHARSVRALRELWATPRPAPIVLRPELPQALSDLTMALIALDRDVRPRDAAEVMEQLSAIGGLSERQSPDASLAYLVTPALVGRGRALRRVRGALATALEGSGRSLVLRGRPGVGCSRMADASALEAQLRGALVLRVHGAHHTAADFSAAEQVIEQLRLIALEQGSGTTRPSSSGVRAVPATAEAQAQSKEQVRRAGIARFVDALLTHTGDEPLALIVDDLHLVDEPSVAAFATAVNELDGRTLLFLGTLADTSDTGDASPGAQAAPMSSSLSLRLLIERSRVVQLGPLSARASRELTRSMFGAVPHVGALAERLHGVSRGNPRELIALAQHLVSSGAIGYRAGTFTLPAQVPDDALPGSLAEALRRRIAGLSPLARGLAEAHALLQERALTTSTARVLMPSEPAPVLHAALVELVAADILNTTDGGYVFRHAGWPSALEGALDPATRLRHHRTLAELLLARGDDPLAQGHHALLAGARGLTGEQLRAMLKRYAELGASLFARTSLSGQQVVELFERAEAAQRAQGETDSREMSQVRYLQMTLGALGDASLFFKHAPETERVLTRDSGWDAYQSVDPSLDPMQRVLQALQIAQRDYEAAPERHRFAPAKAIHNLVMYAVAATAVGARTMDVSLRQRMPPLLQPFTPLTPLVAAMHQNCVSAFEGVLLDDEAAIARLPPVIATLSGLGASDQEHADEIRAACTYAIAAYRSRIGVPDHEGLLDQVRDHPRHASNVLRTRATLALHMGDWDGAARFRQAADQRDVEHDDEPMFGLIAVSIMWPLYARGFDLGMVKQLLAMLAPLARRFDGWQNAVHGMLGEYHRMRGDHAEAMAQLELCARGAEPTDPMQHPIGPWYLAEACALEILLAQGRLDECRERAERALRWGDGPRGARYDGVQRALALCQARQGELDAAHRRLDALFAHRHALGTRGIELGMLHEARALCCAWQSDREGAQQALQQARAESCAGGSGYARRMALVERLVESQLGPSPASGVRDTKTSVADPRRRAERALLRLVREGNASRDALLERVDALCRRLGSAEGHLFSLGVDGPRCLGSIGAEGPPTGLSGFVVEQLDPERSTPGVTTDEASTGASQPGASGSDGGTATWLADPTIGAERYRVLVLRDELQADGAPTAALAYRETSDSDQILTRVHS